MNTASVHDRLGRERDEEQQSKSDQSINTASVYYRVNRFCPCSPAARAHRAVGAGSASVASLSLESVASTLEQLRNVIQNNWEKRVGERSKVCATGPCNSIENASKMHRKSSKMAPKWLPEAPQEPNEHETQHGNPILPSREPPKSPLGAVLGPPGSLLAPPGSLLGSILASRGAHFGGFGISFLRLL